MVLKCCGEMCLIIVTDTVGNLCDVDSSLAQQAGGLLHTQVTQELTRRDTSNLFHLTV